MRYNLSDPMQRSAERLIRRRLHNAIATTFCTLVLFGVWMQVSFPFEIEENPLLIGAIALIYNCALYVRWWAGRGLLRRGYYPSNEKEYADVLEEYLKHEVP